MALKMPTMQLFGESGESGCIKNYYLLSLGGFPENNKNPPYFLVGELKETIYDDEDQRRLMKYVVWHTTRKTWGVVYLEKDETDFMLPITEKMGRAIKRMNLLV